MAHQARLSQEQPVNSSNISSQHTSFTLTVSSYDEPCRPGSASCDTWLDPSQAAHQHSSDYKSPTSGNARLPTLSHENSDNEDAHGSTEDSIMGVRAGLMGASGGGSQATSTRAYSRTTNLPPQSRNSRSGKLLKQFRDLYDCLSEVDFRSLIKNDIVKAWKWEMVNCLLAVYLIGTMYFVLLYYDRQPIPDWGTAINLSTLVALIATILRTMLVFVVSEIIGQAKWNYLASGGRSEQIVPVRRLIKTSRFNDASQGFLGAVKLLPTIIQDPATLIAVIVMVVSLGTGSFVQQAVQTQSCQLPVDGAHASLPIARNITGDTKRQENLHYFEDISSPAAAQFALAPESEEYGSPISVGCSTGNCTFYNRFNGIYSTLGVCSMCVDTSSLIRRAAVLVYDENTGLSHELLPAWEDSWRNYSLTNGVSVQATFWNDTLIQSTGLLASSDSTVGLDWAGHLISSEMKGLSQWSFANTTILAPRWISTSSGYTDYVAATCTLYSCLRSYKASVKSGKLEEVLVSTVPAVPNVAAAFPSGETAEEIQNKMEGEYGHQLLTSPGWSNGPQISYGAVQSPCLVDGTIWTRENKSSFIDMQRLILVHAELDTGGRRRVTIEDTTAPAECIYGVETGPKSFPNLRSMLQDLFNGSCIARSFTNESDGIPTVECDQAYWLARLYSDEETTAATITKRIELFTDRFSNKMRMGLLNNPETVSGQVLQMTVCSRIQYIWLIFPAVLVAVTNGLLAWTIIQSSRHHRRVKVWKTSILPFLFYSEQFVVQNAEDVSSGSTESLRREDNAREPLLDLDQMEAEARKRKVRFEAFE